MAALRFHLIGSVNNIKRRKGSLVEPSENLEGKNLTDSWMIWNWMTEGCFINFEFGMDPPPYPLHLSLLMANLLVTGLGPKI